MSDEYQGTQFEKAEIPKDHNFDYTPEELRQRMGLASWQYHQAIEGQRRLEVTKTIREKKTYVILGARRFDLLTNEKLRGHLVDTFEKTPALRPTKEQYEAWIHVEHQAVFDEYYYWESQAKQAEKDHEHWARQLSWHQSTMKKDGIELLTMEGSGGRKF